MQHFKRHLSLLLGLGLMVGLTGCMSTNVPAYQPNTREGYIITKSLKKPIALGNFYLEEDKDKNAILCRLAGNVYLPGKMTYSEYLKDAFIQSLIQAKRYTEKRSGRHQLSAQFQEVTFSTLDGSWTINANVQVDNHRPVVINSVTEFGTSWDAINACKNVADSFSVAAQLFINRTFANPTIRKQLNFGNHVIRKKR
jgi:hypothetical protein